MRRKTKANKNTLLYQAHVNNFRPPSKAPKKTLFNDLEKDVGKYKEKTFKVSSSIYDSQTRRYSHMSHSNSGTKKLID